MDDFNFFNGYEDAIKASYMREGYEIAESLLGTSITKDSLLWIEFMIIGKLRSLYRSELIDEFFDKYKIAISLDEYDKSMVCINLIDKPPRPPLKLAYDDLQRCQSDLYKSNNFNTRKAYTKANKWYQKLLRNRFWWY